MNPNTTLLVEHSPALPGVRFRSFRGTEDYPDIARVTVDSFATDGLPFGTDEDETRNEWSNTTHCDPLKDAIFAELNGCLVGYGQVNASIREDGMQVFNPGAHVIASARRKGIGTAMMHWMMQRIQARAAAEPHAGPREVQSYAFEKSAGKIALLKGFGFEVFRHGFMMRRSLAEPLPEIALPAGLHVRGMTKQHLPRLFAALDEAFRDHYGYTSPSDADRQSWLDDPLHRVELYMVAVDDATGEIAGGVFNRVYHDDNQRLGIKRMWTDPIFVRRPWRKLGLAKALIARSLALARHIGYDDVYLGVDGLNPAGRSSCMKR